MLSLVRVGTASKDQNPFDVRLPASLGIAGILRQVMRNHSSRPQHSIIYATKQLAVRTPNRPHVPLLLQDCCHRDVHPWRVLQQLRLIGVYQISNTFQEWRPVVEWTIDVNPDPQTVIVVVLLSMDFWNCRVKWGGSYPES